MINEIGGFFGLELQSRPGYPHSHALHTHSGCTSLMLLMISHGIRLIYLPFYTCVTVLRAVRSLGCSIRFYNIDDSLNPILDHYDPDSWMLYTNYFGLKDDVVDDLCSRYPNIIIDNSQAFFAKPTSSCFYSPRKFVGIPDGGVAYGAYLDSVGEARDLVPFVPHVSGLMNRITFGASASYSNFLMDESRLSTLEFFSISRLSHSILHSLDYDSIKRKRLTNYKYLHSMLHQFNRLPPAPELSVPLCYPLLCDRPGIRQKLIESRIYVPYYWRGIATFKRLFAPLDPLDANLEVSLAESIVSLPIDQRYSLADMEIVAKLTIDFISDRMMSTGGGGGGGVPSV